MIQRKLTPNISFAPALCLDWDGTIRKSRTSDFIQGPEDVQLIDGVEKMIWRYRDKGFIIIGVSNQGGVAYGHKSEQMVKDEAEMTLALFDRNPFHITKFNWFMEGGVIEPYRHRSLMRKPDYGMLVMAEYEAFNYGFLIDWNNSVFVGDREEDRKCAEKARIKFIDAKDFLIDHDITIDIE